MGTADGPVGGARMGTGVRIRRARGEDVGRIHQVEASCYAAPWSRDTLESVVIRKGVLLLVAEVGWEGEARVVGHGILWRVADEAEIANLAVTPELQGRGIAGALLDGLLKRARRVGVTAVFLEVRESNDPALALYRGRGFRQVGVRKQYYDRPQEDARILRLDLTPRGT
ncbi:MAG: ribosomal-protein-alanine N-acetyltransferase [Gemmatimonadetes bacterium]|nr:ribosomal-protein-alanine N-acetyltransferase [Gemmatimonadota bacterium]